MPFTIHRGTNISEWLSQSERRGAERAAFFTEADAQFIARQGFDHIRLPIDEEQMWTAGGEKEPEAFALLDSALDWCERAGLRVIVDLHILRTHFFISETEPKLFTDPAETQRFANLWCELSEFLGRRSPDFLAYELMNEAVARDPQNWNRVAMAGFQAIRQREPDRKIVLGSNLWNSYNTFDVLEIPQNDPHTILTFHYYHPMLITHYRAWWWEGHIYEGPTHYRGRVVNEADLAGLPDNVVDMVHRHNGEVWNRERIEQDFLKPVEAARKAGYPLYCGEFGAYVATPMPLRLAWFQDVISLFNQYHIAWANWDYKGGFAPVIKDGQATEIVPVLMG